MTKPMLPLHVPVALLAALLPLALQAQGLATPGPQERQRVGMAATGSTGGLVVPSAFVLDPGVVALSMGSYQEPGLGRFSKHENYSLGIGIAPYVELYGRFAEYQNPLPNSRFVRGPRDISANLKVQVPGLPRSWPNLAVGIQDFEGGATYFKSVYGVASDQIGPLRWTAGLAKGSVGVARVKTLNGAFGGVELMLPGTGLSALAEYDGQQNHLGLRYYSPPIASMGHAQIIGTLQRSFGAPSTAAAAGDRSAFNLSLVVPLGPNEARMARDGVRLQAGNELPPIEGTAPVAAAKPAAGQAAAAAPAAPTAPTAAAVVADASERMDMLQRALVATGLERVRIGRLGANLVVEYENQIYGQNEADALGIVFGLAAELAPRGVQRIYAVTLKAGQRLYETSVDLMAYRGFLRQGDSGSVRSGMAFDLQPEYRREDVQWQTAPASSPTRVRVQLKPELNYTLGTEVGAFDYALGANTQFIVPLWAGGEAYVSHISPLAESLEFEPGGQYAASRIHSGIKAAGVQHTQWVAPRLLAHVGVGRFNYDFVGFEAEGRLFVRRDDQIRLRVARYERTNTANPILRQQGVSAAYRWAWDSHTWLEFAAQDYTDGTRGPALAAQRWFGDVGMRAFYRKGGSNTYVGLELVVPLTPRKGLSAGPVQLSGSPMWEKGFRTKLTSAGAPANTVAFDAVREFAPTYSMEGEQLNAGRMSLAYYDTQLQRMRDAFYTYARNQLPK